MKKCMLAILFALYGVSLIMGEDMCGTYTILFKFDLNPQHQSRRTAFTLHKDSSFVMLTEPQNRFGYGREPFLTCFGKWRIENHRLVLGDRYRMDDNGVITDFFYPDYDSNYCNTDICIADTTRWHDEAIHACRFVSGHELYTVNLEYIKVIRNQYFYNSILDAPDEKKRIVAGNGKNSFKNIREHCHLLDSIENRLNKITADGIRFYCYQPYHFSQLNNVRINGIDTRYLKLMPDSSGLWYFRFRDWRRRRDEQGNVHPPYWYQGIVPRGLEEVILLDKQNMLFTLHGGVRIWVFCGKEKIKDGGNVLTNNKIILDSLAAKYFPESSNAKVVDFKNRLLNQKKNTLLHVSERGFIASTGVPKRLMPVYQKILDMFSTTPEEGVAFLNSKRYFGFDEFPFPDPDDLNLDIHKSINGENGLEEFEKYRYEIETDIPETNLFHPSHI